MSFWTDIRGGIEDVSQVIAPITIPVKMGIEAVQGANPKNNPIPTPTNPSATPSATDNQVSQAAQDEDKNNEHGMAANILGGGLYDTTTPQLAKNILLGS